MQEKIVFVFSFTILIYIAMTVHSYYTTKKRAEEMRAIAERIGFAYQEKADHIQASYAHFSLFLQGHAYTRHAINFLLGKKNEVEVSICDYHYTTGAGRSMKRHAQTICIIKDPKFDLPSFFARHEHKVFDYLGKLFGGQDINFNEDEKFSSAFVLQGKVESEIRNLFNQGVRKAFNKFTGSSLQVEGHGDSILFHKGFPLKSEGLNTFLKNIFDVYNALRASDTDC